MPEGPLTLVIDGETYTSVARTKVLEDLPLEDLKDHLEGVLQLGEEARVFEWSVAATEKVIVHGLGFRYPNVIVLDSSGAVREPDIIYVDEYSVRLVSAHPYAGKAIIGPTI